MAELAEGEHTDGMVLMEIMGADLRSWESFREDVTIIATIAGAILGAVALFVALLVARPQQKRWRILICVLMVCLVICGLVLLLMVWFEDVFGSVRWAFQTLWAWLVENWAIVTVAFLVGALAQSRVVRYLTRAGSTKPLHHRLERFLDLVIGPHRYKIVREFAEYCRSCTHMLERADESNGADGSDASDKDRRKDGEQGAESSPTLRTIQTPSRSFKEDDMMAYTAYTEATYAKLFTCAWNYRRLVYLPPGDDQAFADAFVLSFKFVDDLLRNYFLQMIRGRGRGVTCSPEVSIGYTNSVNGLLDLVSQLDLHLPPGHEFSIAFCRDLRDSNDDGNGDAFVGCVRVYDQGGSVRRELVRVFDAEWESMAKPDTITARVNCAVLKTRLGERIIVGEGLPDEQRLEELWTEFRQEWQGNCRTEIFKATWTAAMAAIRRYDENPKHKGNLLEPTVGAKRQRAIETIKEKYDITIPVP